MTTVHGTFRTLGTGLLLAAMVAAPTLAAQEGVFRTVEVASSYERVMRRGEVWTLLTSAFVADQPVLISLVSFAAIATAALSVCPPRVFWTAAAAGQVGSAVGVYAYMSLARALDGGLYTSSVTTPDYGVSTIQGGLVGATAFLLWQRSRGSLRGRALVTVGVGALAVIAWTLHPDPSVLTFEHVVAFALGIGVAAVASRSSPLPAPGRCGRSGGPRQVREQHREPLSRVLLPEGVRVVAWIDPEHVRDAGSA